MKNWWILAVLAALILVVWRLREPFNTYEEALNDVGQTSMSLTPVCPEGSTLNAAKTMCTFSDTTKPDVVPTCSSDTLEFVGGTCRFKGTNTGATGGTSSGTNTGATGGTSSGTNTGATGGTSSGTNTGATGGTSADAVNTGGSSTSSYGPNSGGNKNGQLVFGPTFTGIGNGGNVPSTDSSKTNQYPQLIGGGEKNGQRVRGVESGIGGLTGGTLTSRQPGDMDLIPDPYRVSQQFSSASYSFKTEPTPFLTDFSAFFR